MASPGASRDLIPHSSAGRHDRGVDAARRGGGGGGGNEQVADGRPGAEVRRRAGGGDAGDGGGRGAGRGARGGGGRAEAGDESQDVGADVADAAVAHSSDADRLRGYEEEEGEKHVMRDKTGFPLQKSHGKAAHACSSSLSAHSPLFKQRTRTSSKKGRMRA